MLQECDPSERQAAVPTVRNTECSVCSCQRHKARHIRLLAAEEEKTDALLAPCSSERSCSSTQEKISSFPLFFSAAAQTQKLQQVAKHSPRPLGQSEQGEPGVGGT